MAKSSDSIYEKLKEEIIHLAIKPGTMLREIDIADRFNVSRTPVRDVLVRLENDGLVEVVSQKGTYITKIDVDSISGMMYIREAVEAAILNDIIDNISVGQTNILSLILLEQKEILALPESEERHARFYENDNRFHYNIFAFAGKQGVWEAMYKISPTYNRFRSITYLRQQDELQELYNHHVAMLQYLKKHDRVQVLKVLSEHIYNGLMGIEDVFMRHRDYFI